MASVRHLEWNILNFGHKIFVIVLIYSVSQKIIPPCGLRFSDIFHKRLRILNQFLHTYYTFLSTQDCKFLFNYLQL